MNRPTPTPIAPSSPQRIRLWRALLAGLGVLLLAGGLIWWWFTPATPPLRFKIETNEPNPSIFAISSDASTSLVGHGHDRLRWLDLQSGQLGPIINPRGFVYGGASISPDSQLAVFPMTRSIDPGGALDFELVVLDRAGRIRARRPLGRSYLPVPPRFDDSGRVVAIVINDPPTLWRRITWAPLDPTRDTERIVARALAPLMAALSSDTRTLAYATPGRELTLRNALNGDHQAYLSLGKIASPPELAGIALRNRDRAILATTDAGTAEIHGADGTLLSQTPLFRNGTQSDLVSVDRAGQRAAILGFDPPGRGSPWRQATTHIRQLFGARPTFAPKPAGALVWDTATPAIPYQINSAFRAHLSPGGSTLLTADESGAFSIWNLPPAPPVPERSSQR